MHVRQDRRLKESRGERKTIRYVKGVLEAELKSSDSESQLSEKERSETGRYDSGRTETQKDSKDPCSQSLEVSRNQH